MNMTKELEEIIHRLDNKEYTDEEINVLDGIYSDSILYNSALKEVQTRVEILRDDLRNNNAYNPIEHIKVRVKQPESILKKAYIREIPLDSESIKEKLNDIAGIRIVCTFKSDIYRIADFIKHSDNIRIIEIKDYIEKPKESGYQSYHMIIEVPVYLISGTHWCKVEIQLRTMAMDFWASLEHKIKYKYDWEVPKEIKMDLQSCAKVVDKLDDKMLRLHTKVHNPNDRQVENNL